MPRPLSSAARCLAVLLAALCAPFDAIHPRAVDPVVQISPFAGRWEGVASSGDRHFPVRVDIGSAPHAAVALIDYPAVPVYAAPFEIGIDGDRITLSRNPPGGPPSRMQASLVHDRLRGDFNGAGVRDATLELVRTGPAPATLRESELQFASADAQLAGTVVWPEGAGPHPAIVITHGSGPVHRGQAMYRTEAFRYARRGVAALIYDKRGDGASSGDWRSASLHMLARDALAGVAALRGLPDIRGDRIGVAGHSQGGWIAPLASTLSSDVAFVIATAASGLGPMAQSLHHNANEMRAAGFDPSDIDLAQALRKRLYDGVRAGAYSEALERDLTAAATRSWFPASQLPTPRLEAISEGERQLLLFEPLPMWRKVRVPVLAIWGAEDVHLQAARSRDLIAEALAVAGNGNVSLHVLPGLDHGFLRSVAPDSAWDFPRGDPQVESLIATWLRQHVVEPDSRFRSEKTGAIDA
jgi:dienelactone hydrolase